MREWFQVKLPTEMYWWANAAYWRNALVSEARSESPRAFTGPNKLRAFEFRHTHTTLVPDLIMVLVDTPRSTVILAEFPQFVGPVVGAPLFPGHEGDRVALSAAEKAELREATRAGLQILKLAAPDGARWRVFTQELSLPEQDFLLPDGNCLTSNGQLLVERFAREVLTSAGQWTVFGDDDQAKLAEALVEVEPESAIRGSS